MREKHFAPDAPTGGLYLRRPLRLDGSNTISFDHKLYGVNKSPEKLEKNVICQFTGIRTSVLRSTFTNAGLQIIFDSVPNFVVAWSPEYSFSKLKALKPGQKVNHFNYIGEIGRKDKLSANMIRSAREQGEKEYNFYSVTFFYPTDSDALRTDMESNPGMVYIRKPSASSRGRGIYLVTSLEELLGKEGPKPCIVQRYIDPPLLVNGYKFDVRVYCLVTSIDPLRVYIYKEGLARFCTKKYKPLVQMISPAMKKCVSEDGTVEEGCDELLGKTMEEMRDEITYTHLTNFSLNKFSPDFKAPSNDDDDEESSKWTLSALLSHVSKEVSPKMATFIWDQIRHVTAKAWMSVVKPMKNAVGMADPLAKSGAMSHCYELIGLDFMVDAEYKVWLIEANITPATGTRSPLDLRVKGPMLQSMYDVVGIRMPGEQGPANVLEESAEEFYRAAGSGWQRVFPDARESSMKLFDSMTKNDADLFKMCKQISTGASASSVLGCEVDKSGWASVVEGEREMARWAESVIF